jgi:transposase
MRASYPSDISQEQFSKILPILLSARKQTRPRTLDLYEVFCAILYVIKSGCQWRMLPSDFPKWNSVYTYFQMWSAQGNDEPSLLEKALKKNGWRGPYQQWSERKDKFLHC